jgi:hypothetical protein
MSFPSGGSAPATVCFKRRSASEAGDRYYWRHTYDKLIEAEAKKERRIGLN